MNNTVDKSDKRKAELQQRIKELKKESNYICDYKIVEYYGGLYIEYVPPNN